MILGSPSRSSRKQTAWMVVSAAALLLLALSLMSLALSQVGVAHASPGESAPMTMTEAIALVSATPEPSPEPKKPHVAPVSARAARADAGGSAFRVNLNAADAEQLAEVPGLGRVRVRAILAWRGSHSFVVPADLMRVKGIGAGLYDRIAPYLAVEGPPIVGTKPVAERPGKKKKREGA